MMLTIKYRKQKNPSNKEETNISPLFLTLFTKGTDAFIVSVIFISFVRIKPPKTKLTHLGPHARPSQTPKTGLSPSAGIGPGSPGRSSRTRSSPWTEPSWRRRWGSRRRGWTGCWATRPRAPCGTAGTLRPSETARGGRAQTRTHGCSHPRHQAARAPSSAVGLLWSTNAHGSSPLACVWSPACSARPPVRSGARWRSPGRQRSVSLHRCRLILMNKPSGGICRHPFKEPPPPPI